MPNSLDGPVYACPTHGTEVNAFNPEGCPSCAPPDDLLMRRLERSVELTKRPDDEEDARLLARLRALLADTKKMVVQAEALVASMRDPSDHFRKY